MAAFLDRIEQSLESGCFAPEGRAEHEHLLTLLLNRSNVFARLDAIERHPVLSRQLDRRGLDERYARAVTHFLARLDTRGTR